MKCPKCGVQLPAEREKGVRELCELYGILFKTCEVLCRECFQAGRNSSRRKGESNVEIKRTASCG